jgi:aerobic-type carbon monoxide dehydrogenase small subunit (CoxS/CutS family)
MELRINQKTYQVDADADTPLLWVIRDDLGLTGTKYGCGLAQCGACSVLVDGNVVRACVTPVAGVVGREVTTIEAIEADAVGKRVVAAWVEHQVAQCGYCQSGQVMAATALLKHTPNPAMRRSTRRWSTCAAAAPTTPSMPPCMTWPKGRRLMNTPIDTPPNCSSCWAKRSTCRADAFSPAPPSAHWCWASACRWAPRVQAAAATAERGTQVPAFLEIRPDGTVRLLSPFMEGGQAPSPPWRRSSVKSWMPTPPLRGRQRPARRSLCGDGKRHAHYRRQHVGAHELPDHAPPAPSPAPCCCRPAPSSWACRWRTDHRAGQRGACRVGRSLAYGELGRAMDLPVPDPASVTLRDPSQFRWIGKPVKRLDAYDKSTGKAQYSIDIKVDGMLHAAVQHAPRLGMTVGSLRNEDQVKAMKGVHSVHQLPGAVAVVAERWWHAKRAVEALQVDWQEPAADSKVRPMPADFSSDAWREHLATVKGPARDDENEGDVAAALANAKTKVEASYHNQYLNHAQLEPPSALARFNPDGTLDVWLPNQAPDMFRADIAKRTGLDLPDQPALAAAGRFFGRHFLYDSANPYPQAIALAKAVGRPVKLIWSREEEFLRDVLRPVAVVKFRAGLDADGMPWPSKRSAPPKARPRPSPANRATRSTRPRLKGCRASPTPSPTSASPRSTSKARPCSVTGARWAIR